MTEALAFLNARNLFTGDWNDNFGAREGRVASILEFIAQTFDPSKCANGSVNVGKYDAWAKERFPRGLVGKRGKTLTPDGRIVDTGYRAHVSASFIGTFLSICEFVLLINKNQDGTLPQHRAEELWNSLYEKGLVAEAFSGP